MRLMFRYFTVVIMMTGLALPAMANEPSNLPSEDEAFAAVFENPADLLLNFRLASAQIRNGNLKGAVATLERILTLSPDNSQAQSLLAGAQFRLGNTAESRRIAEMLLANEKASTPQKNEIKSLIAMIDEAEKRFLINGALSLGGGIIDNPDGGSIGNNAYGGGTLSKTADAHAFNTMSASFNFTGKFISQLPERLSVGVSMTRRQTENYNLGDTNSYSLNTRYSKDFEAMRVNMGASATAMTLDGRQYLDTYNAYANTRHALPVGFSGLFTGSVTHNVYRDSFDRTLVRPSSEKTGTTSTLSAKIVRPFVVFQLGFGVTASEIDAKKKYNARETFDYLADVNFLMFGGVASLGLKHSASTYQQGHPDYSNTVREDFTNTVLASYSIGVGRIYQPLEDEPRLNFSASYGKTKSTIANFSKYSGQGQIVVIQPF